MRIVVRNSFARHTIRAERVRVRHSAEHTGNTCTFCGSQRTTNGKSWLYRFHMDDGQGPRNSGPILNGKLFCSRDCAESYIGHSF